MRALFLVLLILVTGLAHAESAANTLTIRWLLAGAPPKLMPDGPFRGTGYGEQQVAWLAKRLPQFTHHLELVTPARLWHEMKTGQGVCSIDILDVPEREAWAVFTRHYTLVPGYEILVLKERVPEFAPFRDRTGAIDLDLLAASDRFVGLYVAGRLYIPQIDSFIESPSRKVRVDAMSASSKIFEMVAGRRADFSFANVSEMTYFNALNAATASSGKPWPPLETLPVKGGDEHAHGHIACSRDPLGQQMVRAIDGLFDNPAEWDAFFAPERRWMDKVIRL